MPNDDKSTILFPEAKALTDHLNSKHLYMNQSEQNAPYNFFDVANKSATNLDPLPASKKKEPDPVKPKHPKDPFISVANLERKWLSEVSDYLYNNKERSIDSIVSNENTLVSQYIRYNSFSRNVLLSAPDSFEINDIILTIPPEQIQISSNNNTLDIPLLRSKSSVKLDTGYGETEISISVVFTDNPFITKKDGQTITLEDELKYKLLPLIVQLKTIPFCQVTNSYLQDKVQSNILNNLLPGQGPVNNDPLGKPLMLTYLNHYIQTTPESPRVVRATFNFSFFNYKAYTNYILYPVKWENDGDLFKRDENGNLTVKSFTFSPRDSTAFYEFYARLFKKRQETIGMTTYQHGVTGDIESERKIMTLKYYEYFEMPYTKLTDDQKEKIKKYANRPKTKSSDTKTKAPVVGRINPDPAKCVRDSAAIIDGFRKADPNITNRALANLLSIISYETDGNLDKEENLNYSEKKFRVVFAKRIREEKLTDEKIKAITKSPKDVGDWMVDGGYNYRGRTGIQITHQDAYIAIGKALGYDFYKNPSMIKSPQYMFPAMLSYFKDFKKVDITKMDAVATTVNSVHLTDGSIDFANRLLIALILQESGKNGVPSLVVKEPAKKAASKTKEVKPESAVVTDYFATEQTEKLLNELLSIEGIEVVYKQNISRTVYFKLPVEMPIYEVGVDNNGATNAYPNGITLDAIEVTSGHNIAKIPLASYRYPTHQYLGGHVGKATLRFTITDSNGDMEFRKILAVINKVSENARNYNQVSAFDGVEIADEGFLNVILGMTHFVVDDVQTQTNPQVPNGSLISITLTDFTGAKEQAEKAFEFEGGKFLDNNGYYEAFAKEIYEKVIKQIKLTVDEQTGNAIIKGTAGQDIVDFGNTIIYGYAKYKIEPYNEKVASIAIIKNFLGVLEKALNQTTTTLYKSSDRGGFQATSIKDCTGLKGKIAIKYGKSLDQDGKYRADQFKTDAFRTDGTNVDLEQAISRVIREFSSRLYDLQDNGKSFFSKITGPDGFPKDDKNATDVISECAYIDYSFLPPSLNPDYYFYYPFNDDEKKKKLTAEKRKEFVSRYKQYSKDFFDGGTNGKGEATANIAERLESMLIKGDSNRNLGNSYTPSDLKFKSDIDYRVKGSPKHSTDETITNSTKDRNKLHLYGDDPDTVKLVVSIGKEKTDEHFPKEDETEKGLFYSSYCDEGGKVAEFHQNFTYDKQTLYDNDSSLLNAFPTYKLYIIEEDAGEFLAAFRQDFNDMFGLNAVQEIRLVQHDDQPADLLVVRFIDMTGSFSSAKFKTYAHQEEAKKPETIDTPLESTDTDGNPLSGLILKEGTAVQLRMGYGNNINKLETCFNGLIVGVESSGSEFVLTCQGYGVELVSAIKNPDKATDITSFNAETKEVLQWCLAQPEVKHFGRWKYMSNSNLQHSDDPSGVNSLNYRYNRIRPDGGESLSWGFVKSQAELNCLAPEESNWAGLNTFITNAVTDVFGSLFSIVKFWDWPDLFNNLFTSFYVYNTTVWSVIDEMTYRYPGYVARVVPYGDRSTLFYGPPDAPYFYRPFNLDEMEKAGEFAGDRKELEEAGIFKKYRDLQKKQQATWDSQQIAWHMWSESKESASAIEARKKVAADLHNQALSEWEDAKTYWNKNLKGNTDAMAAVRSLTIRPFRRYHAINSDKHIVKAAIHADYRDVYTEVQLGYGTSQDEVTNMLQGSNAKQMITLKMNDMLEEEDIRSKFLTFPNAGSVVVAHKYAAQALHLQAKNLYKGSVVTAGNPLYKPFDIVILSDYSTQMYGPIEIKRHIMTFSPYEGFISDIEPAMLNSLSELVTESLTDTYSSLKEGRYAIEKMHDSNSLLENLRTEQGAATIADIGMTGAVALPIAAGGMVATGVFATGAIVGVALMAPFVANIAMRYFLSTKYRNPILLHPLIKNGHPYIYGLDTYKTLGLLAWYDEQWNILEKDLGSFFQVTLQGIKAVNKDVWQN